MLTLRGEIKRWCFHIGELDLSFYALNVRLRMKKLKCDVVDFGAISIY